MADETGRQGNRGAAGSGKGCSKDGGFDGTERGTCVVGFSAPTDAGLYDMEGNVAEWTDGCWDRDCRRKVVRGTSWSNPGRVWGRGGGGGTNAGMRDGECSRLREELRLASASPGLFHDSYWV